MHRRCACTFVVPHAALWDVDWEHRFSHAWNTHSKKNICRTSSLRACVLPRRTKTAASRIYGSCVLWSGSSRLHLRFAKPTALLNVGPVAQLESTTGDNLKEPFEFVDVPAKEVVDNDDNTTVAETTVIGAERDQTDSFRSKSPLSRPVPSDWNVASPSPAPDSPPPRQSSFNNSRQSKSAYETGRSSRFDNNDFPGGRSSRFDNNDIRGGRSMYDNDVARPYPPRGERRRNMYDEMDNNRFTAYARERMFDSNDRMPPPFDDSVADFFNDDFPPRVDEYNTRPPFTLDDFENAERGSIRGGRRWREEVRSSVVDNPSPRRPQRRSRETSASQRKSQWGVSSEDRFRRRTRLNSQHSSEIYGTPVDGSRRGGRRSSSSPSPFASSSSSSSKRSAAMPPEDYDNFIAEMGGGDDDDIEAWYRRRAGEEAPRPPRDGRRSSSSPRSVPREDRSSSSSRSVPREDRYREEEPYQDDRLPQRGARSRRQPASDDQAWWRRDNSNTFKLSDLPADSAWWRNGRALPTPPPKKALPPRKPKDTEEETKAVVVDEKPKTESKLEVSSATTVETAPVVEEKSPSPGVGDIVKVSSLEQQAALAAHKARRQVQEDKERKEADAKRELQEAEERRKQLLDEIARIKAEIGEEAEAMRNTPGPQPDIPPTPLPTSPLPAVSSSIELESTPAEPIQDQPAVFRSVAQFLEFCGAEEYLQLWLDEDMDLDALKSPMITPTLLQTTLGVTKTGKLLRILEGLKVLREQ